MSIDLSKIDPALRGLYSLSNNMKTLKAFPEEQTKAPITFKELNLLVNVIEGILEEQMNVNQILLDKIYALEDKKSKYRFWKLWLL